MPTRPRRPTLNTGVINALSSAPQAVTWKTFCLLFRSQCCLTDKNVFTFQSMTDQACPCFVSRTSPVIQIPTVHNIKFNLECRINRYFSVFTGKARRKEKERRCSSRRGQGREGHSRVLVDHLQERWDGSRDDLGTRRTNSWKAHRRYSFLQWKANGNLTRHSKMYYLGSNMLNGDLVRSIKNPIYTNTGVQI